MLVLGMAPNDNSRNCHKRLRCQRSFIWQDNSHFISACWSPMSAWTWFTILSGRLIYSWEDRKTPMKSLIKMSHKKQVVACAHQKCFMLVDTVSLIPLEITSCHQLKRFNIQPHTCARVTNNWENVDEAQ